MTDANTNTNTNVAEDDDSGWESVPKKPVRRTERKDQKQDNNNNNNNNNNASAAAAVLPWVSFLPPNAKNTTFRPFMVLLCGIPGSGKSTFSKSLEQAMPYKFVRINQDDLGNRIRCEEQTRLAFSEGKCPVIDRCNFDSSQRNKFIAIAYEHKAPVDCVVLETETLVTVEECIQRCTIRRGHPTIQPSEARGVVIGMAKQMTPPKLIGNNEGIRVVHYITNNHRLNDLLVDYMNSNA